MNIHNSLAKKQNNGQVYIAVDFEEYAASENYKNEIFYPTVTLQFVIITQFVINYKLR